MDSRGKSGRFLHTVAEGFKELLFTLLEPPSMNKDRRNEAREERSSTHGYEK
jgi:hypothetical protein